MRQCVLKSALPVDLSLGASQAKDRHLLVFQITGPGSTFLCPALFRSNSPISASFFLAIRSPRRAFLFSVFSAPAFPQVIFGPPQGVTQHLFIGSDAHGGWQAPCCVANSLLAFFQTIPQVRSTPLSHSVSSPSTACQPAAAAHFFSPQPHSAACSPSSLPLPSSVAFGTL